MPERQSERRNLIEKAGAKSFSYVRSLRDFLSGIDKKFGYPIKAISALGVVALGAGMVFTGLDFDTRTQVGLVVMGIGALMYCVNENLTTTPSSD